MDSITALELETALDSALPGVARRAAVRSWRCAAVFLKARLTCAASPELRGCFDELTYLAPPPHEARFAAHALDARPQPISTPSHCSSAPWR